MYVEKKNSPKQIFGKSRGLINPSNVMVNEISENWETGRIYLNIDSD